MDIDKFSLDHIKHHMESVPMSVRSKNLLLILVGLPGSGKSTFCAKMLQSQSSKWKRICQDVISNGKRGSKEQCLKHAEGALKQGYNVLIDRCNLNKGQRQEFVELSRKLCVEAHALVLDLPVKQCIQRALQRTGHEGGLEGKTAPGAIQRMAQSRELPSKAEGFSSIYVCVADTDVEKAVSLYNGCLDNGAQGRDLNVFKESHGQGLETSEREHGPEQNTSRIRTLDEGSKTLAFPSISTSDFQFDHEKAADIIVNTVHDFLENKKHHGLRLLLVDLKEDSDMLVRVLQKAAEHGLESNEFSTLAGDITKLRSTRGMNCNFIANATNWRLKAGGGGVNAAIFKAGGEDLETETKKRAKTLHPGTALAVPLPPTSPLHVSEGVTHVIHVLGPNMNPQRPNYLQGDYVEGCKVLRETYMSLFECFASAVESASYRDSGGKCSELRGTHSLSNQNKSRNAFSVLMESAKRRLIHTSSDQKEKHGRKDTDAINNGFEKSKRDMVDRDEKMTSELDTYGGYATTSARSDSKANYSNKSGWDVHKENLDIHSVRVKAKRWEPWAEALRNIALQPEKHKDGVLQETDKVVVIADKFPKGKKHLLVIAREDGLDSIEELRSSHLQLLQHMHDLGLTWAKSLMNEDQSLVFRMGYHSEPSMRQLHMHVISQDFDSPSLKNKKHWNSFTTSFFRDSKAVMDELERTGRVKPCGDEDSLLKIELRCHKCRSVHPNIPKLKNHIKYCQFPFPADLIQEGYLIAA